MEIENIYSEVYQILNLLGDEYINKLPSSLFNMLKEKRNIDYNPQYNDEDFLNEQKVKKETLSIIVLLYLNYWCKDEKEKLEIKQILKKNEEEYQEELRKKYNVDDIFKNNLKNIKEDIEENKNEIVEYKESLIKKIINKIKSLFKTNI